MYKYVVSEDIQLVCNRFCTFAYTIRMMKYLKMKKIFETTADLCSGWGTETAVRIKTFITK